jgi:hypothetical protein
VTTGDCPGGACAQLAGDAYCAPLCGSGGACASDRQCTVLSDVSGAQVSVCVPRGGVCAAAGGPLDAGAGGFASPDASAGGAASADASAGSSSSADAAAAGSAGEAGAGPGNVCGGLVGPGVSAACYCSPGHTCAANGCYNGWWCNTASGRCQAPPASCAGGGGGMGSGMPYDGGAPPAGSVGSDGGSVSRLYFAIVGDTRPPSPDDTAAYPTSIITQIFTRIEALSPRPSFVVSTGDYMFATTGGAEGSAQLDLYLSARSKFSGVLFPAMGNHECTGYTNSNCGPGNADGVTNNYTAFLSKLLAPVAQTSPYYEIDIAASDGTWTAKFLFVAANAWTQTQAAWLDQAMSRQTTYTLVLRHEPAAANTAPGVLPSENIMGSHPYTLAIVGHTHIYARSGPREIIVGNGGAPLGGSTNYGFGMVSQRADGALAVDMIDYASGATDPVFHFAVNPDGSAAP